MLKSIRIRNFALAADLSVDFAPGLNILTGETGAGKSVLVGAIAAVLGGRVYTEVVRTGFDKAQVDAVADIEKLPGLMALLEEKGLGGGTELFLRREISVKGNSRAFVNDSPVTVGTLSEIGDYLVDIHGQHEHQTLLRRETHRGILDDLGGLSNELAGVGQRYVKLNEDLHRLEALKRRQKELEDQYELNNFQFQEIENARLQSGEEEELNAELKVLSNVEKLFSLCATLNNLFSGEAFSLLQGAQEADVKLKELARYATELGSISEEVSSARIVLEEAARSVESFESSLAYDPERLEAVQSRLEVINLLKKKYGGSVEAVLAHQQKLAESLDLRNNFEGEISRLGKQVAESAANYARAAETLSSGRHRAAEAMQASVAEKLMDLGMPRIRFRAAVELTPDPRGIYLKDGERYSGDGHGIDAVEFFISPNPGEDFKPLSKIASGGEISRIMLALKSILADVDQVPTLIFDEIDSGVSGRIAQAVGRSILELSTSHQIFCITHLPQIAAQGQTHFSVEKYVEEDRTFTRILPLDDPGRIEAIASLIAGENLNETVLASARQLLDENRGAGI